MNFVKQVNKQHGGTILESLLGYIYWEGICPTCCWWRHYLSFPKAAPSS
jgi:hypothetical protein